MAWWHSDCRCWAAVVAPLAAVVGLEAAVEAAGWVVEEVCGGCGWEAAVAAPWNAESRILALTIKVGLCG